MDIDRAREKMVVEQLEQRGIRDPRVLAAMRSLPRHYFLAPKYAEQAYDDGPLPIGQSQTISQPYIVALMSEAAELKGDEKVLEIGTGSGYQAALLCRLAAEVYTVECLDELSRQAQINISRLAIANCHFRIGDGSRGWPEAAPFDVVVVTAAMPGLPRALLEQLAPGGRLVAPIGEEDMQSLVVVDREGGHWRERDLGECRFVKMIGEAGFEP